MLGKAAVAMWWDVAPEMRAEWEHWHSTEHMAERLAIPGFLRGTRWVARSGEPSYFVLYEVAELATITSGAYLDRLNNPTPWSRKMMPHHRNMVRSLCTVRAGWGGGVPQALATVRFSRTPNLPQLPQGQGLTSAHLLESQGRKCLIGYNLRCHPVAAVGERLGHRKSADPDHADRRMERKGEGRHRNSIGIG